MTGLRLLMLLAFAAGGIAIPAAAIADCASLAPPVNPPTGPSRPVTARDLVTLRDIGPKPALFLGQSPLGLSPDGTRVAFQLRRADPDRNSYCIGMFVLDLVPGARPKPVDIGGDMLRLHFTRGTLADYPSGEPRIIVPRWSPSGEQLAFLKASGGPVQLWLAPTHGSGAHALTQSAADVEDFAWTTDGRSIVILSRPALLARRDAIDREGLNGWTYDDRWSPVASNHPWPSAPIPPEYRTYEVSSGRDRPATSEEAALLHPTADLPKSGNIPAAIDGHRRAWIETLTPTRSYSSDALHVSLDGRPVRCSGAACTGRFTGLWWSGKTLLFLHAEGWAASQTALYRWTPGQGAPRRTLITDDLLLGCQPWSRQLLCLEESSLTPRRLVSLDPRTGARTPLFDPNPEFHAIALGRAERLHWTNDLGLPIYGDLVLPPGYRGDKPLPAVLVQYETRGFLRGGTADEFPIQLFAARGFAVLSLERPGFVSSLSPGQTRDEKVRTDYHDWNDRKSVLSAIRNGFALLEHRHIVDPARLGITGLSDGSNTGQFALLNSSLFRAASLASCCEDPKTLMPIMGPFGDRYLSSYTYPPYTNPNPDFWRPYSIAANADRFDVPLLLQSADDEYLASLETFVSLRERGRPVDLYVFPNEHHTKWQPAHRLAIYERNVDWFDFWLNGHQDPAPIKADLYRRWSELRHAPPRAAIDARPANGAPSSTR